MLKCIKTCVLNGTKRILEGQLINDSEVPKCAMDYFEQIAIHPAEVSKSLREVCLDIIEIKKRLDKLEGGENYNREELEKQAKELGIVIHPNIGDKKLFEKINSKLGE